MIKCSRSVESSVAEDIIPDPGSATLVERGPAFLNAGNDKVVQSEPPPPRVILRQQVVHECGAEPVSHLGQRLEISKFFFLTFVSFFYTYIFSSHLLLIKC
jgi:hypothetical protein